MHVYMYTHTISLHVVCYLGLDLGIKMPELVISLNYSSGDEGGKCGKGTEEGSEKGKWEREGE